MSVATESPVAYAASNDQGQLSCDQPLQLPSLPPRVFINLLHPGHQLPFKDCVGSTYGTVKSMATSSPSKSLQPRNFLLALRSVGLVTPWLLHLLASDVLLSLLLPISFVAPSFVYHTSSSIAYWVWLGVQRIFTSWNRARITTSGDRLPKNESAVVIANHVSWTDFYLIQELACDAGMLGSCRWFAKQQLKWVPFLGWGLWAMGMPLISRNWDKDQRELQRVFHGPKTRNWPMCTYR